LDMALLELRAVCTVVLILEVSSQVERVLMVPHLDDSISRASLLLAPVAVEVIIVSRFESLFYF
jgi:hypothetical protein